MLYYILITFDLIARMMLALAWLIAPICSLPQIFVFRLKTHPLMEEYRWIMLLLFLCRGDIDIGGNVDAIDGMVEYVKSF